MRRAGIILLLLFQAVFLNIVVPGHTRGIVTTSGKSSVKSLGDLVCSDCCKKKPGQSPASAPTRQDRKNCLICAVAATFTAATGFACTLQELGMLERLGPCVPESVEAFTFIHTYDACAPPAHA